MSNQLQFMENEQVPRRLQLSHDFDLPHRRGPSPVEHKQHRTEPPTARVSGKHRRSFGTIVLIVAVIVFIIAASASHSVANLLSNLVARH
jgi:hypothetical protein